MHGTDPLDQVAEGLLALDDTAGIAVQRDGPDAVREPEMHSTFDGLTGSIRHIDGTTRQRFISA